MLKAARGPIMSDDIEDRIGLLGEFKVSLQNWQNTRSPIQRQWLNENRHTVEREVIEAGCFRTLTVSPPAAVGGYVARNVNPFDGMFQPVNFANMIPIIIDMLDQTVGRLKNPLPEPKPTPTADIQIQIQRGYAFIAMPMDENNHELVDVCEAIQRAASDCGIVAQRIDEDESSERITDRILESIRKAEFVIVDLTEERPNVFFEAGYAHGFGKLPIYIARHGTQIHFDVKDYPVIFFRNMKELREKLERRFRGIAEKSEVGA
jgi:hypothetical protein